MNSWHSNNWEFETIPDVPGECGTTHCLAGWAQALSKDIAVRQLPASVAGIVLIPTASHMFYETNENAMCFLRDREYAKEEANK